MFDAPVYVMLYGLRSIRDELARVFNCPPLTADRVIIEAWTSMEVTDA